jgi:murein DD-endopeptidase MepM/ murein hydrolase activator NlpD
MSITRKQIYWGLGIATGITTVGIIIHQNSKTIKDAASSVAGATTDKLQNWLHPVAAKISSPFGYRTHPVTKVQQFHNGVDLPVPVNTQIKSPMGGMVAEVYSNAAGGNQLVIKHDNGFTTGYAHLTKALVKKGDKIKQGDIIAMSGNTGKTTGPHLHFTLKDKSGNWVDPAKLVYGVAA